MIKKQAFNLGVDLENKSEFRQFLTDLSTQIDSLIKTVNDQASRTAPATSTSSGLPGQIAYSSGYIYICIAKNSWKRAALSSF